MYGAEEAEGIAAAVKVPRYIEPKNMERDVLKVDLARRNKQKEKFRLIIGMILFCFWVMWRYFFW